jgi:hypothetical protein
MSTALFNELHVNLQTPGLSPKSQLPSLQQNRRWARAALVAALLPVSAAKTRRLTSVSGTLPIKARPASLNLDSRDVPSPMTAFQTRDTATMSTTIETMPGASTIHKQVKYPDRSFFSLGDPSNSQRIYQFDLPPLSWAAISCQVASVLLLPMTWHL